MLKLSTRENMKSIAKFLLAVFSFAPMTVAAAPVSQTAGSNLTGYNGSMGSVMGNQWNAATNPRQGSQNSGAKADVGNCEAVILRCAKPKCAGGGCADMAVAQSIAAGCVNSNATCKKHGDALISSVAGQLVASSTAVVNQQAAAAAAAQASADQNNQMMQQQMQQMQQQMMQMQEQSNAQIASLQSQLVESQQATADAVAAAAQNAAQSVAANTSTVIDAGTGLNAVQTAAAKSGVDEEVISRATITGQILTSMEGVDTSLNNLKTAMRAAFKYAGCNEVNGDNCTGPKRVKKFRELANKFMEPYDALSDNLEDALYKAQSVGVDLGNIYMFFSGSCNSWAEYICRGSNTNMVYTTSGKSCQMMNCNGLQSVSNTPCVDGKVLICNNTNEANCVGGKSKSGNGIRGGHECYDGQVVPPEDLVACAINKTLNSEDPVTRDQILNPDTTENGSIRIGCAGSGLGVGLIKRRSSSGKGKSGIDIDLLELIINQSESGSKFQTTCSTTIKEKNDNSYGSACYCGLGRGKNHETAVKKLRAVTISKTLKDGQQGVCCSEEGQDKCNVDCYDMTLDVSYIDPLFALCDTHVWNDGQQDNDKITTDSEKQKRVKEIIGLKSTVITQQMYKQYTTLEKMLKQLKIMLEKEVLKASLQVSGASGDGDSSGGTDKVEFTKCSAFDDETALSCLRDNYAKMQPLVESGRLNTNYKKQLKEDCAVVEALGLWTSADGKSCDVCQSLNSKKNMQDCLNVIAWGINKLNKRIKEENSKNNSVGFRLVTQ